MRDDLQLNKDVREVGIGQVCVVSQPVWLEALGLGSCVAVIAYDFQKKIGGIAHVMLSGRAPTLRPYAKLKYAEDAIDFLLSELKRRGSALQGLKLYLVGGANVLRNPHDTVCSALIDSVCGYLMGLGFSSITKALGGFLARKTCLDTETGRVYCAEGDGEWCLLG